MSNKKNAAKAAPQPRKDKPVTSTPEKKKTRGPYTKGIDSKTLKIAYFEKGEDAVKQLVLDKKASIGTLKSARAASEGTVADAFQRVLDALGVSSTRGMSRQKPGETRKFKTQQLAKGGPFSRVQFPTEFYKKGSQFTQSIDERGRITITPEGYDEVPAGNDVELPQDSHFAQPAANAE